jgi:hypothetical protein
MTSSSKNVMMIAIRNENGAKITEKFPTVSR